MRMFFSAELLLKNVWTKNNEVIKGIKEMEQVIMKGSKYEILDVNIAAKTTVCAMP